MKEKEDADEEETGSSSASENEEFPDVVVSIDKLQTTRVDQEEVSHEGLNHISRF